MNGSPIPHPQYLIERRKALVDTARCLHQIIALRHEIAQRNETYNLGLDLPGDRPYHEALSRCSEIHKQENAG